MANVATQASDVLERRGLPGAVGTLDAFRDGEDQFVFKRPADDLDTDGESFIRMRDWDGRAGKACQIQPLRKAHGIAVSDAGPIVSFTMTKRGARGNRREKNRRVLHLAKNFGAEKIAIGAGFHEVFECYWSFGIRVREVFAQDGADFVFMASDALANQIANHPAEEKPP